MDTSPIILAVPVFFGLIAIEAFYLQATGKNGYRLDDSIASISCGIGEQTLEVFYKVSALAVYQYLLENAAIVDLPKNWATTILIFIAIDFLYYWFHRKSHEINFLWASHVVHHQSEEYNLTTALRQSWVSKFIAYTFFLPLAFLGVDTETVVYMYAINLIYQFWIHASRVGKLGLLEYVFNTASHHRVHHGIDPKYIDKNFGGVFIVWDRVFGTFKEEEERPSFGITYQIKSWNPLWANWEYWDNMLRSMKKFDNIVDKASLLISRPGWMPDYLGGYKPAPELDPARVKYSPQANSTLKIYVLIQYGLTLALSPQFVKYAFQLTMPQKLIAAVLIVFSIISCGVLQEGKTWGRYAELFRIPLSAAAFAFAFPLGDNQLYAQIFAVAYMLFSYFWLINRWKHFDVEV